MTSAPTNRGPVRAALVLLAAGSGSRVGHEINKVFLPLAGRRVFTWSLRWATAIPDITRLILVIAERDRALAESVLAREAPGVDVRLVRGGSTRHASEWNALQSLAGEIHRGDFDVVVVHDAARPLAGTAVFAHVITQALAHGGALPVRPQPSLVPVDGTAPSPGHDVVAVQTPQAFRAQPLLAAYERADEARFVGTDTASCIEKFAELPIWCVPGSAQNIKITFPEDLFLAEHLLAQAHWDLTTESGEPL
ncbi:MAG: 2-C-methyl-D-erythritol 4-phosphate cytidylyltransferase [Propionibacteriales bacterium]|nr:2-C-methyl-D-erythritol 4-phosphate cytidylyltransferase [Propionibacteriales bacterium]